MTHLDFFKPSRPQGEPGPQCQVPFSSCAGLELSPLSKNPGTGTTSLHLQPPVLAAGPARALPAQLPEEPSGSLQLLLPRCCRGPGQDCGHSPEAAGRVCPCAAGAQGWLRCGWPGSIPGVTASNPAGTWCSLPISEVFGAPGFSDLGDSLACRRNPERSHQGWVSGRGGGCSW